MECVASMRLMPFGEVFNHRYEQRESWFPEHGNVVERVRLSTLDIFVVQEGEIKVLTSFRLLCTSERVLVSLPPCNSL